MSGRFRLSPFLSSEMAAAAQSCPALSFAQIEFDTLEVCGYWYSTFLLGRFFHMNTRCLGTNKIQIRAPLVFGGL
jgi:hypothetical protein